MSGSSPETLPQFVAEAQKHGVKAMVSIGGATGSVHWSAMVSTDEKRTAYVKTIVDFAQKYKLDGVDIDWEYPNSPGDAGNTHDPADTANFLSFLQELRKTPVGKNLILTAATYVAPFKGPDGSPLSDMSGFAKVLDWIAVMNYDIWGSWSPSVGPNAPIDDACAPSAYQQGSATSAIKKWTAAGFPTNQIVLGVPGYGHSFKVSKDKAYDKESPGTLAAYPPFEKSSQPAGDPWGSSGGNFNMWGLVQNGYLNEDGSVKDGVPYRYDECSQTPYVYNPEKEVMVSFDNAQSFTRKGKFIKEQNLRGWAMWEVGSDHKDILVDSIRAAMGS